MNALFTALSAFLYPQGVVCAVCGKETHVGADGLCEVCRAALIPGGVFKGAPPLAEVSCGLVYTEAIERPMHQLKYYRRADYASFFAQYMELPTAWEANCICPVPLHPFKEWRRGYNQCALLIEALSERCDLPPVRTDLLRRVRNTRSQARLSPKERRTNVAGAFRALPAAEGLTIVLVDDVYTTGNTLSECAAMLMDTGARRVYALCACRAGQGKPAEEK